MRIVSLVPSLTETLHDLGVGGHIVGVTKFCVHPPEARTNAAVVGGTKDPDVPQILSLRPDLVIADEDENRPPDLEALRAAGTRVHVTRIATVGDALREVAAIGALVGRSHEAEKFAADTQEEADRIRAAANLAPRVRVFVPIWRRPLMTIGGATYMSDLLSLVGGKNVFAGAQKKYFETSLDEVRAQRAEAALLPTEPYRFRERDRAEFAQWLDLPIEAVRVVDGQAFTWFGTRTRPALPVLAEAVASVRAALTSSQPS